MTESWSALDTPAHAGPTTLRASEFRSWSQRGFALVVDLLVHSVLSVGAGTAAGILLGLMQGAGWIDGSWVGRIEKFGDGLGAIAVGMLGLYVFRATSLAIGNATIGKLFLGQRVFQLRPGTPVRKGVGELDYELEAEPCSARAAFVRELLTPIDGIFFGVVAWSTMQRSQLSQRLGDQAARTVVVRSGAEPASARRSTAQAWFGVAIGAIALEFLAMSAFVLAAI